MATERLTRDEQQARTRQRLLDAAATVFARHGYHGASVGDIAAEAGFTKGAVYSNFTGKEDLFLTVLEDRMSQRLSEIRDTFSDSDTLDDIRGGGREVARLVDADRDLWLLFMEFWVHAAREPDVRERFAALYDSWRRDLGSLIADRFERLDMPPPAAPERLASAAIALSEGHALQRLIHPQDSGRRPDPDRAAPHVAAGPAVTDEDYGDWLAYLFAGMAATGLDVDIDALREFREAMTA